MGNKLKKLQQLQQKSGQERTYLGQWWSSGLVRLVLVLDLFGRWHIEDVLLWDTRKREEAQRRESAMSIRVSRVRFVEKRNAEGETG